MVDTCVPLHTCMLDTCVPPPLCVVLRYTTCDVTGSLQDPFPLYPGESLEGHGGGGE